MKRQLSALQDYFQELGISRTANLPNGTGAPPASLNLCTILIGDGLGELNTVKSTLNSSFYSFIAAPFYPQYTKKRDSTVPKSPHLKICLPPLASTLTLHRS